MQVKKLSGKQRSARFVVLFIFNISVLTSQGFDLSLTKKPAKQGFPSGQRGRTQDPLTQVFAGS
ncbi:MAG: hypothetical protein COZ66_01790, partial [Candidatus Huberarchaeum crystalense]